MKAISIESGELRFRHDHPEPSPNPGEVLLKVQQAGVCETDVQLARGYMAFEGILGHEFVGVAKAGQYAGCRVVGEINCNCQQCSRCRAGLGNHCANRTVIGIDRHHGAFAEWVSVPEHNLYLIPDDVSDDEAVFTEPVAAALQIAEQVALQTSDRAAVLGDGRLAYLSAQVLHNGCGHVTVIGKHSAKLQRFQQRGMTVSFVNEDHERKSYDVVVDCTGSDSGLPLAMELVRPRGTIVMKTTIAIDHRLSLAPVVIDEITIVGSRCGPFAKAIQAIQDHTIDVAGLITHRFELESARQAMQTAVRPDAFKVIFDIAAANAD